MADLSEHPYITICYEAKCAPDSFHHRYGELADRYNRETGEQITANEVQAAADDFWTQSRSSVDSTSPANAARFRNA